MDNPIVVENQKPGTPESVWDAPASNQIEGFATDISVEHGNTVSFKINLNVAPSATAPYHIEIYRLGYYGGDGATLVTTLTGLTGKAQPEPITDSRGLVDAGDWSVSASWATPATAVSGVYLAKLVRDDNGATNQIPFIVRSDESKSDIVMQTSDTTWEAYNGWAGNNGQVGPSLYGGYTQPPDLSADPSPVDYNRAFAVSYNRPFITRDGGGAYAGGQDYLFGADFAAIYWLEKNGYDVSYISGVDTDRLGASELTQHKAFISVGHDEYWSGDQRANVEAARDAGVNLLFWSGNEVYWKTRWENSIVDGQSYRTLVSYKETKFNYSPNAGPQDYANVDPSNQWTGTWRDTRFVDAVGPDGVTHIAVGARPENSLTGQLFIADGNTSGGALDVPSSDASLREWRNTGIGPNGATGLAPGILGYEWDTSPVDANRPAGLIKLSDTTLDWPAILTDQGNRTSPGTATHTLTLYRAPSGALVFGAGTVFWSWGLSDQHDSSPYGANIASPALQQFTVNMFADMGIQPGVTDATLQAEGLVRASASNDHVAATATLTGVPDTAAALSPVTISGTATDVSNDPSNTDGHVALVEVSVDGGHTWNPAQGTSNWTYSWDPSTPGAYTVEARAIDDTLNLPAGAEIATHVVTVTRPTSLSLFESATPTNGQVFNDGQSIEVGMKFQAAAAGTISALSYYRAAADAGDTDTRQGHLWSSTGVLLGTVTFVSGPGQSGWQEATLSTPVQIQAGATYVVSYNSANNYLATDGYFTSTVTDPYGVLDAPSSASAGGNGVYAYGAGQQFPNQTYNSANYWVDVVFTPSSGVLTPWRLALDPASDSGLAGDGVTNHPVLVIDGSADPGASVTLYEGSAAVGSGVANSTGGFQITTSSLADGVHDLTATATVGSSTSSASSALAVTVDTQAPLAPTGLADAAIVGGVVSDGNTASQTLTGVAEKGASVTVYDNATVLGTTSADASTGQWSYTLGALADGAHSLTAAATDVAGNSGPSSGALAFTVGPPTSFSLFGSVTPSGQVYNDNQPVELGMKFEATTAGTITALSYYRAPSDAGDTDTRQGHLWSSTGVLLGTVTFVSGPGQSGWQEATLSTPVQIQAGATYIVSYKTGDNYLATGGYFTSTVTDPHGELDAPSSAAAGGNGVYAYGSALQVPNQTYNSANYWVDVAFTPGSLAATPSSLALDPTSDSGVAGDGVTNHPVLLIDGAADPGASVTLYEGSVAIGSGVASTTGAFQITTSSLADGVHSLTATATVGSSTSGPSSPTTVTVDTQAPLAPTGLADAAIVGGSVDSASNTASQTLTGVAEDGASVTVHDGAATLGTTTADASTGQWSYTLGALADGSHSLTATATDAAGNTGAASGALAFTVTPQTSFSLFDSVTPNGQLYNENLPLELGMKFQATTAGTITALSYFRAPADAGDTDTRTGHLWSSDGTLLGTVTFTSAPGQTGWQEATLSTPVQVLAGATYIVSYKTLDNYYATGSYFTSTVTDPHGELDAPSSAAAGGNGVYAYGSALQFPNQTYNAANYWVDVVFTPGSLAAASSHLALALPSDSGAAGDSLANHAAQLIDGATDPGAAVILHGGTGDQTKTGGWGADTFALGAGFGADTVTEFATGTTHLEFSRTLSASGMSDSDMHGHVLDHAATSGVDTILNIDHTDQVALRGGGLSSLNTADFIFAWA